MDGEREIRLKKLEGGNLLAFKAHRAPYLYCTVREWHKGSKTRTESSNENMKVVKAVKT